MFFKTAQDEGTYHFIGKEFRSMKIKVTYLRLLSSKQVQYFFHSLQFTCLFKSCMLQIQVRCCRWAFLYSNSYKSEILLLTTNILIFKAQISRFKISSYFRAKNSLWIQVTLIFFCNFLLNESTSFQYIPKEGIN